MYTKIMASGPITSREIDGETVSDFILGASKSLQMVITAKKLKDTCSLEGKYDQPNSIFKSSDITSSTNVHLVKPMVFAVVMYGCES